MSTFKKTHSAFCLVIGSALFAPTAGAAALVLSSTPLFLTPTVAPNILVVLDNSQSMDAYMAGTLVSGDNVNTRANIGRNVMRSVITSYRSVFNWGLMSFGLTTTNPAPFNTYAYYMGTDTSMKFTSTADCVGGSTTAGPDGVYTSGVSTITGKRCVHNPQPFAGSEFVTYDRAGDDVDILDVLYTGTTFSQSWAVSPGTTAGTNYNVYVNHNAVNTWNVPADFNTATFGVNPIGFTYTDAGFLTSNPPYTRQVFLPRVKTASAQCGYYSDITGYGTINEAVKPDSTTHYNTMMSKLGSETCTTGSAEIKDAAVFTPTQGTLISARQYFAGTNGFTTPITSSCQKNFTVLVTDGLPTGNTSGGLYSLADRTNTLSGTTWTFGAAAQDAINAACALRLPTSSSPLSAYCTGARPTNTAADPIPPSDIQTYVLALSDTVANASASAVMNAMANAGGGNSSAYFASSATAFSTAFDSIAADILGKIGAASSVATNSSALATGSNIYQAKFSATTWSGELLAFAIDPTNGTVSISPSWQGGANSWITGGVPNQQTATQRNIFTYKPSNTQGLQGIPFLWPAVPATPTATELDVSQSSALNTSASGTADTLGSIRLNYLRGDPSNEGTGSSNFRIRPASKLGDIVDSSPAYVAWPDAGYPAALEAANYATFRSNQKTRTKMIYVGANDGMLHGFDATSGREVMAYVPSKVYANLSKLTPSSGYSHKYFVNGSSTIADVFFGGAWHTVLVGSLAQGGQGIFALDITNPAAFTQTVTNAQSLVLWEFNDSDNPATAFVDGDSELGYTFSQPAVGRVCTSWSGSTCNASKWVAIFGNGYNTASTTGDAVLYVVDIATGQLVKKIDTNSGTFTPYYCPPAAAGTCSPTPNGLSSATIVDVNGDYYIDYVYAGDLKGNMWKFDFTGTSSSAWSVAYGSTGTPAPLYQAKDSAGKTQPITSMPQITGHPTGSGYLVYFGTGKYIETGIDVATTNTETQTFYGIWDNGATVTSVTGRDSTILLQQAIDAIDTTGNWRHTTKNAINWTTQKGWYMDLCLNASGTGSCSNNGGEKQVSNSVLANGRIIFTTLIPDTTACYGGSSWLMELDFATGGQTTTTPFDVNNDGVFSTSDVAGFGSSVGNAQANGTKFPSIVGKPTLVFNPNNKTTYKYSNTSGGDVVKTNNNLGQGIGRVSWRELLND